MQTSTNVIINLVKSFEKSQWNYKPDFNIVKDLPIITREDIQKMDMEKGMYSCRSSGSTGEPVVVQKTIHDYIWHTATNLRELIWRKWDFSKNFAIIKPVYKNMSTMSGWGFPQALFPNQGQIYKIGFEPIDTIQSWLEHLNPHYIQSYPSIIEQIDKSKISNFIDAKSTGEKGGTMYSSEECGTIAISCPDNPQNYHVMENQLVETDSEGHAIITTINNKYIKRYKIGDIIELGECSCGRTLQTITKIHGRVRNFFVMPDGRKKWPLVGSIHFYQRYGIRQFKAIQHGLNDLEIQVIKTKDFPEDELKKTVSDALDSKINIRITYVTAFPNYKHEEFVSLL